MEIEITVRDSGTNLNLLERMPISEFKILIENDSELLLDLVKRMECKISGGNSEKIDGADNYVFYPPAV